LAETLCRPLPLSRPHPPIMVGGGGEQKTLRLVARYADACNLFAFDLEQVRQKLDVLRRRCEEEGRDYDAIEKTTLGLPPVSRDGTEGTISINEAVERIGALAELGIEHHMIGRPSSDEAFDLLATELLPRVQSIAVAAS
ncbi:MAG: LLM class flavin-dependent oxidoreductase, partial [Chloroflexia bacterium]|nr:LLM class flavin-dependent oxidoreductase [Chloroflexia bacterium]